MTLEKTENILNDFSITPKQLNNLKYYLCSLVKKTAFIANNESYWEHLRNSFLNIVVQNIQKAWMIQNDEELDSVLQKDVKQDYLDLDFEKILNTQIRYSADKNNGVIWVLCTCIMILGEYKFFWKLLQEK